MSRSIPIMEVNNYTDIFTQPIFNNQQGEWYRDVGYKDSLDIIRDNFQSAAKSFIAIGYYLKHMKDKELFLEGGYANIWDCAQAEFGLSQTAASRFMSMNDAFSVRGDTPLLDEKYNDFNKSQLQELLALPEEKREEIKADQTVGEIRRIAKEEKKTREPSEKEIRAFYEYGAAKYDTDRSQLRELLVKELGKNYTGGNCIGFPFECTPRGITLRDADEITWAQLVRLINLYIPVTQLPGQINIKDYPEYLPDKEIIGEELQEAPPSLKGSNHIQTRYEHMEIKGDIVVDSENERLIISNAKILLNGKCCKDKVSIIIEDVSTE